MEKRWNARVGTGDPRENPPTSGIVRQDSHMRKSGSDFHRCSDSEVLAADEGEMGVRMEQRRNEREGENGISPRQPADQRRRPARFPRAKSSSVGMQGLGEAGESRENSPTSVIVRHDSHLRKSLRYPARDRTLFTAVGGERSNRSATSDSNVKQAVVNTESQHDRDIARQYSAFARKSDETLGTCDIVILIAPTIPRLKRGKDLQTGGVLKGEPSPPYLILDLSSWSNTGEPFCDISWPDHVASASGRRAPALVKLLWQPDVPTGMTAVAEWLDCTPSFLTNRVQSRDSRMWESCRDDAADRRVFSGISRPCIPALLHTHLASPSSALKTSTTCVMGASPLSREWPQYIPAPLWSLDPAVCAERCDKRTENLPRRGQGTNSLSLDYKSATLPLITPELGRGGDRAPLYHDDSTSASTLPLSGRYNRAHGTRQPCYSHNAGVPFILNKPDLMRVGFALRSIPFSSRLSY
ncbi:hypothetical protein PR048_031098 [Dryococelus australis]|uniref:Uncharacterized protein n=1 Tax=Dryococelus australis TaxID=614101 RepID=A0ABQ9G776_9NEOP|nr:hypothetical protein PR048_031098 [Dryococelus australis]